NLYPFQMTISRPGVSFEDAVENIDIGGPSMLRSAAKNHEFVLPVVDPIDYPKVLDLLRRDGLTPAVRREFAAKVFAHTADYDAAIAGYLTPREEGLPRRLGIAMERTQALRYGENPGQRAALYVTEEPRGMRDLTQRHGKELSFNNLLDLEGAMLATEPFGEQPCCAIVKHTTPCGLATGTDALDAYKKALACDPVSAFGSIIAFTVPVDDVAAEAVSSLFVECVVAPEFSDGALEILGRKKNLRVLEGRARWPNNSLDYKRVRGGLLVQERPPEVIDDSAWRVVTKRQPTEEERRDLLFAWRAVASVKSNAIVLARDGATIGIGAGQMSRVDAAFLAVHKATTIGHSTQGAALGSDAYFPFRDGIDQAASAGVNAIVQPGGSIRDEEVIAAADEHGMTMVFTGVRLFRH
ncbi:MAG TPA: bifunctional phosphoribosylaminoimidazolecarboxamide formyltransferase/IMP cyclohydrolase, partial [Gemmatimonadaceae bacterium]